MVYDRSYDSPASRGYWLSGTESMDYESYLTLLHRTLDYLDTLFENDKGGIPLQYQGAEVIRRTLQRVADYHGYPSVRTSFSPLPDHVFFRSTEEMQLPAIERASYEELTPEERDDARELRQREIGDQSKVVGNSGKTDSLLDNVRRKIQRIREYKHRLGPVVSNWLRRRLAKPVVSALSKQLYLDTQRSRNVIDSTNYIFYPLQYFMESRVTMRAPAFYNQLWLIEFLSRSLPPGYELVVKDHPQQLGALPLSHTRAISRYANAIDPTIPAREVIVQADAVVTLNNTVGYEAILYGKPVVSLGDAFYSHAGYTQDVTNIQTLQSELNRAVQSTGLTDEDVLSFAHGVLDSSYRGSWGNTCSENVELFVESVESYLETQ
ncbi:hypothetical protein ACFQJ7_16890 [Halovenus rubra]|uniref:Capsule polysaccharide biosynthesis protein n=2 Tax=Halovenus rubra TaxID=869890 RepID=A0ABD5X8U9_9EURY|nr:hypothetical protein [Halovenus rubra]